MKIFYCFWGFFLLLITNCFSQNDAELIHIGNLPAEGVLLDKGWKFQVGDDSAYANPLYDDKAWEPINPALDINDLPQIPRSGIAWIRLHLSIDSALNKQLVLIIQQSGASEIFLDGKLIHRFGTLSADPEKVKAYDPQWKPVSLPISKIARHVLAVRFALQPHIRYTTMFTTNNHALWMQVKDVESGVDFYGEHVSLFITHEFFLIGVWFLFCVLHFAFFIFDPMQKANLYFALYASFYATAMVIQHVFYLRTHEVADKFFLGNVSFVFFSTGNLLLLTALSRLLQQKRDIFYWGLICVVGVSFFLNAGLYRWGWILGGVLTQNLIHMNMARIAFLAFRRKRKGALIIVTGAACYVILFALFLTGGLSDRDYSLTITYLYTILFSTHLLSIPIATSIYLGLEFAFVNRSLQKKLKEVNELSEKTLAQEKEKQEILTSQNVVLESQVQERTIALSQSLKELKETQTLMIQQEKMASLGQVTAGIAHEIQNPLNFVNNFSDINNELIDELKEELETGNLQLATEIADDIKQNEEKINHHGKRADAIVKGMLQHSRTSTGVKEPTDINKLVDEYLRLSYHGMRAKDKRFNVQIKTEFDEIIEKINVVPQDIGRVLLNLLNNAFYAVNEKAKLSSHGFQPTVKVSTRRLNNSIEINAEDNGMGISQKVIDKIFQPFFTTKPTGQGTGLGLSLSYDIIKAHGGEIKVETNEGEGSEFIIQIPIS